MLEEKTLKQIAKIIKENEKEIKQLYDNCSFETPVKNDLILSSQNMAYNDIKTIVKNYIKMKREEK